MSDVPEYFGTASGERVASRCTSSASCGDHVCCLSEGHHGRHESREFAEPARSLFAAWDDYTGDAEPYACSHEEIDHQGFCDLLTCSLPHPGAMKHEVVRCTRCGVRYRQVDDPDGTMTLTYRSPSSSGWRNKRIRYEALDA